ncbi:MAG: recombinase family protein [Candidatus Yanofskybacteria bacterium]|nr:recombinase family protein [Candidatus Yanofskybacteria bacterium]
MSANSFTDTKQTKGKATKPVVALYLRVSTSIQDFEMQLKELRDEVKKVGATIYEEYTDTIGGGTQVSERRYAEDVIEDAKTGKFQTLLVWRIDRIARDEEFGLNYLRRIEETGCRIKFLTNSAIDTPVPPTPEALSMVKTMRVMLLMGARMQLDNIKVNTRASKTQWIKSNKWPSPGHVPFGYRLTADYGLEITPDRAEIVKRIFNMYKDEDYSVREIVAILNEEKIPSGTPNGWKKDRIQDMLSNPVYLGALPIKGKKLGPIHTFHCDPIISQETFNKIKNKRIERTERSKRNTERDYPFQGLLRCELCGYPLHCITSTNPYTENYSYGFTRRLVDGKNIKDKRCSGRGCGRVSERNIIESLYTSIVKFFANSTAREIEQWFIEGSIVKEHKGDIEKQIKLEQAELNLLSAKQDKYIDLFTDLNQPISVQEKCKKLLNNLEHTIRAKEGKIHSLKQSLLSVKEKDDDRNDAINLAIYFKALFQKLKREPVSDYNTRYKLALTILRFVNVIYVNLQTGHLQVHMRAEHEKLKIKIIDSPEDSNGGSSTGSDGEVNVVSSGLDNGIKNGNSVKMRLSERTQIELSR